MIERKTYYLAGPMQGIPQFNFPAFDSAAAKLRTNLYQIISPAELDGAESRTAALASTNGDLTKLPETWGDFLGRDVQIIADEADGVIVLPDWYRSRGARLEAFTAHLWGKPVYRYAVFADGLSLSESEIRPDDLMVELCQPIKPFVPKRKGCGRVFLPPYPDAGGVAPELKTSPGFDREEMLDALDVDETELGWGHPPAVVEDELLEEAIRLGMTEDAFTVEKESPIELDLNPKDELLETANRYGYGSPRETVNDFPRDDEIPAGWTPDRPGDYEIPLRRPYGWGNPYLQYGQRDPDTGEVRTTSKTGGQKGMKPERIDLIPPGFLEELGRVYGKGAAKYSDNNYLKGYDWSKSYGAMLRHTMKWAGGESWDAETGCHHLAMAAWHCSTLYTFETEDIGTDDRTIHAIRKKEAQ